MREISAADARRAVWVWAAAQAIYIMAIAGRTSMGVAGVQGMEHFKVDASRIAVFTAVQLGVYAASQIPAGLAIDRWGPRKLLLAGAIIMSLGQAVLALTTSYPVAVTARVFIGAGDATAFLSVMRIIPAWFPLRKAPIFTQLTSALGQIGQLLSAVPFAMVLRSAGWLPAFSALAAAGLVVAAAAMFVIRDAPSSGEVSKPASGLGGAELSLPEKLKIVVTEPVCWAGFFTHWNGMLCQVVFLLLWGVPLMTLAMGVSPAAASGMLVANTAVTVVAGPAAGFISARLGRRREVAVVTATVITGVAWVMFFSSPTPRGFGALMAANMVMAALAPIANFGFDTIRELLDRRILATATGLANAGGFFAAMIATQAIGIMLDAQAVGRDYDWADFRFASLSVGILLATGLAGFVVSRHLAAKKFPPKHTPTF